MKRIQSISPEVRKALKTKVDAIGRQIVADATGYRYHTLSSKLNGILALSQEECDKIQFAIEKLPKILP